MFPRWINFYTSNALTYVKVAPHSNFMIFESMREIYFLPNTSPGIFYLIEFDVSDSSSLSGEIRKIGIYREKMHLCIFPGSSNRYMLFTAIHVRKAKFLLSPNVTVWFLKLCYIRMNMRYSSYDSGFTKNNNCVLPKFFMALLPIG